jgi:hypothetical protein
MKDNFAKEAQMKILILFFLFVSALSVQASPYPVEKLRPVNRVFVCSSSGLDSFDFLTGRADAPLNTEGKGWKIEPTGWQSRTGFSPFFYGDWPVSDGWQGYSYPYLQAFYLFKIVPTVPAFADPSFEIRGYNVTNIHRIKIDAPDAVYKCKEDPIDQAYAAIVKKDLPTLARLAGSLSVTGRGLLAPAAAAQGLAGFVKYIPADDAQDSLAYAADIPTAQALLRMGARLDKKPNYVRQDSRLPYWSLALLDGNIDLAKFYFEQTPHTGGMDDAALELLRLKRAGIQIDMTATFQFIETYNKTLDPQIQYHFDRFFLDTRQTCDDPRSFYSHYLCLSMIDSKNPYYWELEAGNIQTAYSIFSFAVETHDLPLLQYELSVYPNGASDALYTAASLANESMIQYILSTKLLTADKIQNVANDFYFVSHGKCKSLRALGAGNCPSEETFRNILSKYFVPAGRPSMFVVRDLQDLQYLESLGANINEPRPPLSNFNAIIGDLEDAPTLIYFAAWNLPRYVYDNICDINDGYLNVINELIKRPTIEVNYISQNKFNAATSSLFDLLFHAYSEHAFSQDCTLIPESQKKVLETIKLLIHSKNVNLNLPNALGKTPKQRACAFAEKYPEFKDVCALFP